MKTIRHRLIRSAALIGALLLPVILVNSFDTPPDAEVVTTMEAMNVAPPDAENSYFDLFALGIPEGEDVHEFGVRLIRAKVAADMLNADAGMRAEYEALADRASTIGWRGRDPSEWCPESFADCLGQIARHQDELLAIAKSNALRLDRYRALYRYGHFQEPLHARTNPELRSFFAKTEHSTVLALAALKAVDGRGEEAVRELADDTAYWRRVMAGGTLLVSKMVAARFIQRNLQLAAEIIRREPGLAGRDKLFDALTRPFSEEEKSLENALWGEFQLFNHTIQNDRYWPADNWGERLLQRLFFKKNSTSQLLHGYFVRLQELAAMPVEKLEAAAERLSRDPFESAGITRVGMVYNPLGKLPLLEHARTIPSNIVRYRGRIHNLNGMSRLLAIQVEIYRAGLPEAEIPDFLGKRPAALHDPYRNAPFHWDRDTRELWFEGIDPGGERGEIVMKRFGVRL